MTGLSTLNPFFLSLLPLAALPILFHLFFRLKKQARPFPTLMFFHRIDAKLNARRRLREWLILLLRTLLMVALLLALARPVWFGIGKEGTVAVVLIIDNSGSMSGTGERGQSKLKEAVGAARGVIAQLRAQDSAGLVLLVPDPAVPLPTGLTQDKRALHAVLDAVSETEASGSVAAAIEHAVSLLDASSAAHCEIHFLSDLQQEKWNQAPVNLRIPRRGTRLVVHRLASPAATLPNVSLARVQCPARSVVAGRRIPLEAQLINPGAAEAHVRLNWVDDAGNRGGEDYTLPPQADKTAAITIETPNPGVRWAMLSLEGDEFAADNRAGVVFTCAEKQSVLFIGHPGDFGYLPLAMSPTGEGRLSGLVPSYSDTDTLAPALADRQAALVVMTWGTLARPGPSSAARLTALHQFLTSGGSVLLVPAPNASGSALAMPAWLNLAPESLQGASNGLALTVLDQANPMFNDLRDDHGEVALRNVKVFRFLPLRVSPTNTPVLGLEDGRVVLASQQVGRGTLLASGLAFDSTWSTLPLKPGFLALAQGLALAGAGAQTNLVSFVAGDPFRLALPANDTLRIQSLGGSALDWKGKPTQFTTFPRAGIYAVRAGAETDYVAVRASDKEGRQRFIANDALPALGQLAYSVRNFSGGDALISEFRRLEKSLELSPLFWLLAFAAFCAEGWLANPPPIKAKAAGLKSPAIKPREHAPVA